MSRLQRGLTGMNSAAGGGSSYSRLGSQSQMGGPGGQSITSDMTQKITIKLADLSQVAK